MVDVRPFAPGDEVRMGAPAAAHAAEAAMVGVSWAQSVRDAAQVGPTWTALSDDGRVLGIGGFSLPWRWRAQAWCFLAPAIPRPAWVAIHRQVRWRTDCLPSLGVHRAEMHVALGFAAGRRWAEMLGYREEALCRGWGPGGEDFWQFARVWP